MHEHVGALQDPTGLVALDMTDEVPPGPPASGFEGEHLLLETVRSVLGQVGRPATGGEFVEERERHVR